MVDNILYIDLAFDMKTQTEQLTYHLKRIQTN